MLAALQVRAVVRVAALMCLVGMCGGAAVAQSLPPLLPLQPLQPLQLAALTPVEEVLLPAPARAPADNGPFGMPAAQGGAMAAKWRSLQPAILIEARILELCRTNSQICTPAAASFLSLIEVARGRNGRARVGEINRAINLAIRPESDLARFNVPDVWATPLMTFASGAGDCEDYAIAKYVALRGAGVAAEDLRIVIVRNRARNEDHAVAAARVDGEWLILDNRNMLLLTDRQATGLTPLVTLDEEDRGQTVYVARAG